MKKLLIALLASWLLIAGLAFNPAGTAGQSNLEAEILKIEERITAAYLRKDVEGFFQDNAPELTAFHASNPYRVDNQQMIRDALKVFYKDSSPTGLYKLQPRVQLYGDTAVVTYHFVETGEAEGGKLYAYEGKQTDVFVKKQGKWTLVHFHSSRVTKPS
jgi:ketosteroid isomerase-like protein